MNKETFLLEKPNKFQKWGFFLINIGAFEKLRRVLDSQSCLTILLLIQVEFVLVKLDGL